ncbi:hypothetical protein NPIL_233541 [Nephila pilipes]|uniref:Uncharacterized protein n=1 Tax=Nephila pilipes TaxID=299642 RepID=A0A8X6NUH9_NEPPI|nr:hypothetical protein NPIL_60971 [Nephila pilipes]GFT33807.1 hypothetical protein NPIL_433521 [Nephila pilipes]GFT93846.1 hypothetical protein NPIL_35081 [Nephila pilipes]GFU07079.1 hypothetical protein NPIL_233541 [Nephila pilipes]
MTFSVGCVHHFTSYTPSPILVRHEPRSPVIVMTTFSTTAVSPEGGASHPGSLVAVSQTGHRIQRPSRSTRTGPPQTRWTKLPLQRLSVQRH